MNNEQPKKRSNYDVVSIRGSGEDKPVNYVRDAYLIDRKQKTGGEFVKVFSDIFLKHEAGKKAYC
ncbi:MAG TPA: hypothetical protein VMT55_04510 [Candidatus Sulfotelmatobacter sp.]|nr:hypothetical protein [Candidatus Sulfotelmatobacter sp.]